MIYFIVAAVKNYAFPQMEATEKRGGEPGLKI